MEYYELSFEIMHKLWFLSHYDCHITEVDLNYFAELLNKMEVLYREKH